VQAKQLYIPLTGQLMKAHDLLYAVKRCEEDAKRLYDSIEAAVKAEGATNAHFMALINLKLAAIKAGIVREGSAKRRTSMAVSGPPSGRKFSRALTLETTNLSGGEQPSPAILPLTPMTAAGAAPPTPSVASSPMNLRTVVNVHAEDEKKEGGREMSIVLPTAAPQSGLVPGAAIPAGTAEPPFLLLVAAPQLP
jgi:hypothetical protein